MNFLLIFIALIGHAFLWIGLINRLHSVGIPRRIIKTVTVVFFGLAGAIPVLAAWKCVSGFKRPGDASWLWDAGTSAFVAYTVLCWLVAVATCFRWAYFHFLRRCPHVVREHSRRAVEVDHDSAAATPDEAEHHFLARLPYNEILQLEVAEWTLDAPRLPTELDGLEIVHISDVHFTGRIGKAYFREMARVANELQPDLICLTGDIVDETECIDWIPDTLGQLSAKSGVYFILGNHDVRVDVNLLRATLSKNGLTDLGGRFLQVGVRGASVVLAGNERPWFSPAPDMTDCPAAAPDGPFRVVLSHTPDQLGWARSQNFDLMLAGHTHGGQIRIPALGAIFTPTLYGVKHIGGVYYAEPTILHVTHGISADFPVRWNCAPEISRLVLRVAS